jgi:hypothetical protein
VKLVAVAFPESCMVEDENGMASLHHACANAATAYSFDVAMTLLEVNPESSTIADNHGRTPAQILKQFASQRDENVIYFEIAQKVRPITPPDRSKIHK